MSPEVILKKPHNFSVDFFSLGVIVYELMMGKRPYNGKSRKELKEQISGFEKLKIIKAQELYKNLKNK